MELLLRLKQTKRQAISHLSSDFVWQETNKKSKPEIVEWLKTHLTAEVYAAQGVVKRLWERLQSTPNPQEAKCSVPFSERLFRWKVITDEMALYRVACWLWIRCLSLCSCYHQWPDQEAAVKMLVSSWLYTSSITSSQRRKTFLWPCDTCIEFGHQCVFRMKKLCSGSKVLFQRLGVHIHD